MAKKFKALRNELEKRPYHAEKAEAAQARLSAEILLHDKTLADLRKARQYTQTQLSKALDVGQPEISRIEHQTDLHLSTLRSYLQAMGGDLMLVAQFGTECVRVTLEEVSDAAFGDDKAKDDDDDLLLSK